MTFKTLPTPYNYAENARVYVPEEAVAIQNASSYEMGQYISDTIEKIDGARGTFDVGSFYFA